MRHQKKIGVPPEAQPRQGVGLGHAAGRDPLFVQVGHRRGVGVALVAEPTRVDILRLREENGWLPDLDELRGLVKAAGGRVR